MKKNSLNHFNRLFDRDRFLFQPVDFVPLPHPSFSAGWFDYFPNRNQQILAKNIGKKHYQVKLNLIFNYSGNLNDRLLSLLNQKPRFFPICFPQLSTLSNRVTLSNYISKLSLLAKTSFLKSPVKITNQSGSNNIRYSAIYAN